ncbi:MAG: DNA polymerase/3'-5' exonuclease PolX [Actinobacteria bacterium]|nr:DNA polymerase/3'-5' exonuclease PolX [Actinomycetota bacterium]
MDKKEIVKLLNEISIIYEIMDENFFKIRAYANAARALEMSGIDINKSTTLVELKKIKGIGTHIAEQIKTLAETGSLKLYEDLKNSTPPSLHQMMKIPKLGPKKIKYLYDNLEITTIDELECACLENKLLNLPNFGQKTQENILKGIELLNRFREKFLFASVIEEAQKLHEKIADLPSVIRSSLGGSIRRKNEIVKDIDIVASTKNPQEVMDMFTSVEEAEEVIAKGDTKSSIRLKSQVNADIRTVSDSQYPYALHHFTGSKEHNTAMRSMAKKNDIKMNEYGLFRNGKLIECKSEEEIFRVFGMDYIPPEIRENTGELEAALNKNIPKLVELGDIKGIFHFHTNRSDGKMSLEQACNELKKMGFEYCGVADHSKTARYAGGIKDEDIEFYLDEIDLLNSTQEDFKIFKGIESDILSDGNLDYPDEILKKFDFVIIAIHSNFNMSQKLMTERIIKAMSNKYSTMLAHPTGRLLLARDPYNVDIIEVIDAAREYKVDLEINASPFRLDLDWRACKYAKEKGVKIFINPDAHHIEGFHEYKFGVNTARKGWLEKEDIANTMGSNEMKDYLDEKKSSKDP